MPPTFRDRRIDIFDGVVNAQFIEREIACKTPCQLCRPLIA
jgi:hypothetical protein